MSKRFYPWEEWFALVKFSVTYKVDYTCSHSSMVQQIRNAASQRRLLVRVIERPEKSNIEVEVLNATQ